MDNISQIKSKEENIHKLKSYLDEDKISSGFATSLFSQFEKRGTLSDKQWGWVLKLVDQVDNPPPPSQKLPNIKGVLALMKRAVDPKGKTFPKLWLKLSDSDLRIHRATSASKYNGQLMLTDGKGYGRNLYFGRIDTKGDLFLAREGKQRSQEIIDLLTRLVADPEKVVSEYGNLSGNCFACHKQLTDDRSIRVGYGKVCAKKFGLRWG
jgi:hypothetical protein|tara:strand:+ start:360 stop:986 length:627 start_codon:yes stop_codon:yes gene_type:complete